MYEDSIAHTARPRHRSVLPADVAEHWNLLRSPRISVNEKFGARDDKASMLRELVRTLVYTDAYFIYTDSTNGHRHSWRPEWDARLGKAIGPADHAQARPARPQELRGWDGPLAPRDSGGSRHDRCRHASRVSLGRPTSAHVHAEAGRGARPCAYALRPVDRRSGTT